MKQDERNLQMTCVRWFRLQYPKVWICNFSTDTKYAGTAEQRAIQGAIKNRMGYTAGTADLLIMKPSGDYFALFVEFKVGKGKQSKAQEDFQLYCFKNRYRYFLCYTFDDFFEFVNEYLKTK